MGKVLGATSSLSCSRTVSRLSPSSGTATATLLLLLLWSCCALGDCSSLLQGNCAQPWPAPQPGHSPSLPHSQGTGRLSSGLPQRKNKARLSPGLPPPTQSSSQIPQGQSLAHPASPSGSVSTLVVKHCPKRS